MELAAVQNTEAQAHVSGDLSRAIPNEDGSIDPFGLYPDGSRMHKSGTLAIALGSEEAAEAMLTSSKKACDDLMAHRAQVATQQALAARINLLRRTVKITPTHPLKMLASYPLVGRQGNRRNGSWVPSGKACLQQGKLSCFLSRIDTRAAGTLFCKNQSG
jgi:hypothetical protein